MKKDIKNFIADWKLSTNWERMVYTLVTLLQVAIGVFSCYFLVLATQHESYIELLYSYGLFVILLPVCKIKVTPKAKKEVAKDTK